MCIKLFCLLLLFLIIVVVNTDIFVTSLYMLFYFFFGSRNICAFYLTMANQEEDATDLHFPKGEDYLCN